MAEFLDKDGLAHFWEKLNRYLTTQFADFNNLLMAKANISDVNKIVTFSTVISLPSDDKTMTMDNVSAIIANDGSSFSGQLYSQVYSGYFVVPLHISYYYYSSESDFHSSKSKFLPNCTYGISAPMTVNRKTCYNISLKSIGQWTEWTGYFKVECLLIKKPVPQKA